MVPSMSTIPNASVISRFRMDRILLKTSTQSQRDSNLNKHAITQQVGLVLAADAMLATDTRIANGKLPVRIDCRSDTSTTRLLVRLLTSLPGRSLSIFIRCSEFNKPEILA